MLAAIQKGAIVLGLSALAVIPPAQASTAVYTFGGLLSGSLKECLSNAKAAATKAGFTANQQEILDANQKGGDFHASKPDDVTPFIGPGAMRVGGYAAAA